MSDLDNREIQMRHAKGDRPNRVFLGQAICDHRDEAIAVLRRTAEDEDDPNRASALYRLGELASKDPQLKKIIKNYLNDPNRGVRSAAHKALHLSNTR